MGTILNIILFVFILGILVFIHELGHFLTAKKKWCFYSRIFNRYGTFNKDNKRKRWN